MGHADREGGVYAFVQSNLVFFCRPCTNKFLFCRRWYALLAKEPRKRIEKSSLFFPFVWTNVAFHLLCCRVEITDIDKPALEKSEA